MTTPQLQENQNGHQEDGYPDMAPLMPNRPIIHREGNGGRGDNQQFSQFLFQQAAMQEDLFGFLTLGHIVNPLELELVKRLYVISMRDWNSDAHNREGRYQEEERLAADWSAKMINLSEVVDDQGDKVKTEEDLLHEWHINHAFLSQVKIQKKKFGLEAVQQHKERVLECRQAMQETEFEASLLPPANYQYFWHRVRQYQVMTERTEDLALGVPTRDYTEVKRKLAGGVSIHKVIYEMPWACRRLYGRVMASLADGDTIRRHFAILYTREWPAEERAPDGKKGKLGFGDRNDRRDEADRDSDNDRNRNRNRSRRKDD